MKKKKVNFLVNFIITFYISIAAYDIYTEKTKESELYKKFLEVKPSRLQWQTDFIKESVKMSQKSVAARINELQAFIVGILLSSARFVIKDDEEKKDSSDSQS